MSISNKINGFVNKNNIYPGNMDLSYEEYIKNELGELNPNESEAYYSDDIISLIGWNTSKNGIQDLAYTTLSGNMQHGARIHIENGMQTKLHTHNYIELAYVVHGKLVQNIMGKNEIFYEKEMCLIDSESYHNDILFNEESTVLFLGFDPDFFDQFLHTEKFIPYIEDYIIKLIAHKKEKYEFVRFHPKDGADKTKRTFEILVEELFNSSPCKPKIVKAYIERLLHLLPVEYRFVLTRKEQNELVNMLMRDIKNYVKDNCETLNVTQLADIFKYNPDYLSKLCYKRTGMTLSQLIIHSRMKKALYLLQNTDYPVAEIARQVGYNNVGFFYKKFKGIYHSSPNSLRSN